MRYIVESAECECIVWFRTEAEREDWTKRNCYFDGIGWNLRDRSRYPVMGTSRRVFWYEEEKR